MKMQKKKAPKRRVRNPILKQGPTTAKIKVRLDPRTFITIKEMSALAFWKTKYPDATIVSNE
jgi:hypothetical protein